MKKTSLFVLFAAFLLVCGSASGKQFRVCSKTEAHARFTTLAAAVQSAAVSDGDTIYVEPGHYETGNISVNKKLTILGPGYYLLDNGINAMNEGSAVFANTIYMEKEGSVISGCQVLGGINLYRGTTASGCHTNSIAISSNSVVIQDCYNTGGIHFSRYADGSNSLIQNNIILGRITTDGLNGSFTGVVIRNNTMVKDFWYQDGTRYDYLVQNAFTYSEIYNNIIINTSTQDGGSELVFHPTLLDMGSGNSIYHNILSCSANSALRNSVFNKRVQDVLVGDSASTIEGYYMHNANSGAEGAGFYGSTIGAYGSYAGSRPYTPAGIPQYRPYIIDATIDNMPSAENTINATFKIKIQQ